MVANLFRCLSPVSCSSAFTSFSIHLSFDQVADHTRLHYAVASLKYPECQPPVSCGMALQVLPGATCNEESYSLLSENTLVDAARPGPRPALFNQHDLIELRTQKNVHNRVQNSRGIESGDENAARIQRLRPLDRIARSDCWKIPCTV